MFPLQNVLYCQGQNRRTAYYWICYFIVQKMYNQILNMYFEYNTIYLQAGEQCHENFNKNIDHSHFHSWSSSVCSKRTSIFFKDRISFQSSGYHGMHFVNQTGLELRCLPASAFQMLRLKKYTSTPGLNKHSFFFRLVLQSFSF